MWSHNRLVRSYLAPQPPPKCQHVADPIWGSTREEKYEHTLGCGYDPFVGDIRSTYDYRDAYLGYSRSKSHAVFLEFIMPPTVTDRSHQSRPSGSTATSLNPMDGPNSPSWVRRIALLNSIGKHKHHYPPVPPVVDSCCSPPFTFLASALMVCWVRQASHSSGPIAAPFPPMIVMARSCSLSSRGGASPPHGRPFANCTISFVRLVFHPIGTLGIELFPTPAA